MSAGEVAEYARNPGRLGNLCIATGGGNDLGEGITHAHTMAPVQAPRHGTGKRLDPQRLIPLSRRQGSEFTGALAIALQLILAQVRAVGPQQRCGDAR